MTAQGPFGKSSSKKVQAQVSLEYLLILAGFFSALAIALPAISYTTEQFVLANDTLLAKDISEKLNEQINLFEFLADGSQKTFEFIPAKLISISLQNKELIISSNQKSFTIKLNSTQTFAHEFDSKFAVIIKKINAGIEISFI